MLIMMIVIVLAQIDCFYSNIFTGLIVSLCLAVPNVVCTSTFTTFHEPTEHYDAFNILSLDHLVEIVDSVISGALRKDDFDVFI